MIGWDGSVYDISASTFARELYRELGRHQAVPYAGAIARQALLQKYQADKGQAEGCHWHLARVYAGPKGGGPIASVRGEKRNLPKNTGFKEFLDKDRAKSPVASAQTFVGRRRLVQRALRAFEDDACSGVLIHGMDRLGKSSLAARIANRLPGHKPVVIFEHYHADQVLDRILSALSPALGKELRQTWAASVGETAADLKPALKDALDRSDDQPLLLIIDDLEQILEEPEAGRSVLVRSNFQAMLSAVLKAFEQNNSESQLLLTSRYRFVLKDDTDRDLTDRLHDLPLPEMTPGERARQLRAEQALQDQPSNDPTEDDAKKEDRKAALFQRVLSAAKGNPGLQSLLTLQVAPDPDLAEEPIREVEAYYEKGGQPRTGDLCEFFQKLTLSIYRKALTPPEEAQLRADLVFKQPAPLVVMKAAGAAAMVEQPDLAIERLTSLGLLDVIGSDEQSFSTVNALARSLFDPLTASEPRKSSRSIPGSAMSDRSR